MSTGRAFSMGALWAAAVVTYFALVPVLYNDPAADRDAVNRVVSLPIEVPTWGPSAVLDFGLYRAGYLPWHGIG
jgi:hypothetical protein